MAKALGVLIGKCSFEFDLEDVTSCHLSENSKLIAVVQRDGQLCVISPSSACKTTRVPGRFQSVCWIPGEPEEESTLLTLDVDGHLSLFAISINEPCEIEIQCLTQCHRNTVQSLLSDWIKDPIDEIPEKQLYSGGHNCAVLSFGTFVVILDVKAGRTPEVRGAFELEEILCLKDGILLGLESDGLTVQIWDTRSCHRLSSLKLHGVRAGIIKYGTILDSLDLAAFVDQDNNVFIIDLNRFFRSDFQSSNVDDDHVVPAETPPKDEDLFNVKTAPRRHSYRDSFWTQNLTFLKPTTYNVESRWYDKYNFHPQRASAFPKPTYKGQGFSERKKNRLSGFSTKENTEKVETMGCTQVLVYEKELSGFDVKGLYSTGAIIVIQAHREGVPVLMVINSITKEEVTTELSPGSVLVPSYSSIFPSLLLTSSGIEMFVLDIEKEKLVNSVMLYESAGVADTLCRHNGWDRCTIPIHALEVGLHHRQLDTVAFFLKSRENIFISHDSNTLPPKPTSPSADLPLPKPGDLDLGQVEPAIELLIRTVMNNITDKQCRQFAEQLLHVTLNYLHKVTFHVNDQLAKVRKAGESTEQFELEVGGVLLTVMGYIGQLRSCMGCSRQKVRERSGSCQQHPLQQQQQQSEVDGNTTDAQNPNMIHLTDAQKKLLRNWKTMSQEEAITDGILSGQLPVLQLFLRQQNKASDPGLPNVIEFGLKKAFEFLQDRQLLYSAQIFANLGFDVWTKLRQICLFTPDKSLRDYLVSELEADGHLTKDELDMIVFVRRLEGLYSCPSFELAKELRLESTEGDWEEETDLSDVLTAENSSSSVVGTIGEIAPRDVVNSETACYGHFILEWFRDWDEETKQRVQIDQLIKRRHMSHAEGISSALVWRYLIAHRDTKRITHWINCAFKNPEEDLEPRMNQDWPFSLPIDPSFFAELHNDDPSWANQILDHLAKRGLFSPGEVNMRSMEARLARVHGLFSEPHLLDQRPEQHGVALYDLHHHILSKCIQHHLPDLLYFYLDYWKLCQGETDLLEVGIARNKLEPWVSMVLHMRAVASDLNDPMRVFSASLSASAFIQGKTSQTVSVSSMLEDGLVGRALATLVYNPEELQDMLLDGSSETGPSIGKWEAALSLFPRLRTALCDKSTTTPSQHDVNVYDLLQGNVPFDISQLFGWQRTNNFFTGDMYSELPHFGSSDLSSQYGRRMSLTYKYYLRQGRPSFAFSSYIIGILQAGMKTIPARRLKNVIHQTHLLALRKFNQTPVSAACVAFMEMLGHDTTLVRVDLHVASLILAHQHGEMTGSVEQRRQAEELFEKNIAWLMTGCVKRKKKQQQEVLSLLETAVRWHIERQSLKSCSPEVLGLWQLVLMFCHSHNLPPSMAYLRDCAEADDWLMFLTFAQIHRLDKDQVHVEVSQFSKPPLREHLHYVVENVGLIAPQSQQTHSQQSEAPIPARDVRAQLYSRIGLTRAQGRSEESYSESSLSGEDSEVVEKEEVSTKSKKALVLPHEANFDDVFSVLLACDEMNSPWTCLNAFCIRYRNPVLAVLAACYKEHVNISCLCSWLIASVSDNSYQTILESFGECELRSWTIQDVQLMVLTLSKDLIFKTLFDGFSIFFSESIFLPFLRFCLSFHRYEDQEVCRQHLDTFKTQHSAALRKQIPEAKQQSDVEMGLSVSWVEETVRSLLCQFLDLKTSSYDMGRLLQLLDQTNVTRLFTAHHVPDFSKLYRLHQMIAPLELTLNYMDLTSVSEPQYRNACDRALQALEENKMYNEARVFAETASIPAEMITIRQVKEELSELRQSSVWQQSDIRCNFWKRCSDNFSKYQVSHPIATAFFQEGLATSEGHKERGLLCQLAYDWLQVGDDSNNQKLKKDLFVQMWMSKIRDLMESDEDGSNVEDISWMVDSEGDTMSSGQRSDLLQYGHIPSEIDKPCVVLSLEEKAALVKLIGKLLDSGKVKDACQVAALISQYSQNLTLVITCLRLALGHVAPADLNMSIKKLIASPGPRLSRRLSTPAYSLVPLSSYSSLSSYEGNDDADNTIVSTIRLLLEHVTDGEACGKRILITYQISQVLGKSFEWTVAQDEFVILQALLNSNHSLRFHLTKDFLSFSRLAPSQVVGFLNDVILKILTTNTAEEGPTGREDTVDRGWVSVRSGSSLVLSVVQLCDDPGLLGQTLHDNMSALLSSNPEMSTTPLNVCVELLVAAHHCHTMACSMEGIATVLRSARSLTDILSNAEEYNLLIRLLMGVGRFSEMTYIFDILKHHHHLERLFSKGVDKNESLRMAILDYVQRCHPSDTDTFKMVSLYFTMYREIATMLEDNATRLLKGLTGKTLDSSGDNQATLQSIVHYFSDAAESYAKENCLRQAQHCVKKARLVALQLQLLHSGQRVVNLNKEELASFIPSHPKFWEAYIVADAYGSHIHWASAISKRFLLQGDHKYLTELQAHIKITPSLISDVVERFKQEPNKPKSAGNHVKKLLGMCNDVQTSYRLTLSLGYTEYARELLKGDNGAYLRDVLGSS